MDDCIPIDDLEKLASLRASGAPAEEEFRTTKQRIIRSSDGHRADARESSVPVSRSDGYSFAEAVESGFRNYATFAGRAPRSEYWYWTLFVVVCTFFIGLVDGIAGTTIGLEGVGIFSLVFTLITFLPCISICGRRMHESWSLRMVGLASSHSKSSAGLLCLFGPALVASKVRMKTALIHSYNHQQEFV